MPELKHNFLKGRMNKDLDERLVPNGEYRDALNIEVSTSEGSDVGTVQNILGNSEINIPFITNDFECVGSIADEKADSSYWFLRGPEFDSNSVFPTTTGVYSRDYIIRLKDETVDIIFTDTKHIISFAEVPVGYGPQFDVSLDFIYNIIVLEKIGKAALLIK